MWYNPYIVKKYPTQQESDKMPKLANRSEFYAAAKSLFGNVESLSRSEVLEVCQKKNVPMPNWLLGDRAYRVGRGRYSLVAGVAAPRFKEKPVKVPRTAPKMLSPTVGPVMQKILETVDTVPVMNMNDAAMAATILQMNPLAQMQEFNLVPKKVTGYVPFGNFSDIRTILKSQKFYPTYITGLSGNGKTMMVEQACAQLERECVRVNITIETDEDDLIGGFRLQDGKTVWQNGPVVVAMERGAVLLLDEVDLGSNKLMCLQPVLEGKPIYLKKVNRVVTPAPGFNIVATANTKGKGSDDGRFIGTNVMNEAFLERFSITVEQEYPSSKIESQILTNLLGASNVSEPGFVDILVNWADVIRKTFYDGAVSEIISTRRLVHICETFLIFKNREKSVRLCLNRYDVDTMNSFMELYKKLDASVNPLPADQTDPIDNPGLDARLAEVAF
jgi:hypothetical protein